MKTAYGIGTQINTQACGIDKEAINTLSHRQRSFDMDAETTPWGKGQSLQEMERRQLNKSEADPFLTPYAKAT